MNIEILKFIAITDFCLVNCNRMNRLIEQLSLSPLDTILDKIFVDFFSF